MNWEKREGVVVGICLSACVHDDDEFSARYVVCRGRAWRCGIWNFGSAGTYGKCVSSISLGNAPLPDDTTATRKRYT